MRLRLGLRLRTSEGAGEGEGETSALGCGGAMQCSAMQCSAVRCGAVQCGVQCLLLTDKGGRVDRRVVEHAEDVTLPPRWARALRLSTVEARTPLAPSAAHCSLPLCGCLHQPQAPT